MFLQRKSLVAIEVRRTQHTRGPGDCGAHHVEPASRLAGRLAFSHQARPDDVDFDSFTRGIFALPVQYTLPHNVMGTPAISLAQHSNGLPIGVQLASSPSMDHLVLQLAALQEQAMPLARRVPPLHVCKL